MPQSNSKLKAILSELENRRNLKNASVAKAGNHLVAVRLNEYVPPPTLLVNTSSNTNNAESYGTPYPYPLVIHTNSTVSANDSSFAYKWANYADHSVKYPGGKLGQNDVADLPDRYHDEITPAENTQRSSKTSIICDRCGRCRCAHCRADRQLPPIPNILINDEPCTVDALIDTVTCMRIVRSATRRATRKSNQSRSHSRPRSAGRASSIPRSQVRTNDIEVCGEECDHGESTSTRVKRWSITTALTLILPCVACYWPLRGVKAAATKCYNTPAVRKNVCRCGANHEENCRSSSNCMNDNESCENDDNYIVRARRRDLRASFSGNSNSVRKFVKTQSTDERPMNETIDSGQILLAELQADRSIRKLR